MSFKIIQKLFFIFIFIFFSFRAFTDQAFDKNLKDLSSTKFLSFKELMKNKTVAVLFQPNCNSCKKQIKRLDCLNEVASKIVLIGSFGTEEKVRRSYLKKKSAFKGYYINGDQVTKLGFESDIAPQTIYYSSGKPLQFIGYKSCEKIKRTIKDSYGSS